MTLGGFLFFVMVHMYPFFFFTDNSVLFCQAKEENHFFLLVYEKGLGQKINKDKTNIFFNSNTQPHLQLHI